MDLITYIYDHQWLTIGVLFFVAFSIYAVYPFFYFRRLGIPCPTPMPLIGNMLDLAKWSMAEYDVRMIKKYGPFFGTYLGRFPVLVISDPEMIKLIAVKESHMFTNRQSFFEMQGIPAYYLTSLRDDHWKHVRALMTPAFTSGKLKQIFIDLLLHQLASSGVEMFPVIYANAIQLGDNFQTLIDEDDKVFEAKNMFGHYTMDVIASTAFGLQLDSLKNKNDPFVAQAQLMFKLNVFVIIVAMIFPELMVLKRRLGIKRTILPSVDFFQAIVQQTLNERHQSIQQTGEGKRAQRVDFMDLMAQVHVTDEQMKTDTANHNPNIQQSNVGPWHTKGATTKEILAQGIIFLVGIITQTTYPGLLIHKMAGYETTASTLGFICYTLALNPACQERCADEIRRVIGSDDWQNTTVTYEHVNDMEYLESCIMETMRLYPASVRFDRVCKQDTEVNGLFIPKGMTVNVPIYYLHHNADYFPEPEKFDPDRFMGELRSQVVNSYTYLPFGVGPRSCIGMRLALLEMKAAMCHLLQRFRFRQCDKTENPIEFAKVGLLKAKNGIYLRVESRQ